MSTRDGAPAATLSQAIRAGVAPGGGLYMPAALPAADRAALDPALPLADFAAALLAPFFTGDRLEAALPAICAEALDLDAPLVTPDPARPGLRALELFHGPTGAFKDFGARFLMACFDRLGDPAAPLMVLVATSGDTGGAVGCAAEGRAAVGARILFPAGRVSPFQHLQLTCWRPPVAALEVDGDFDDCQRLVKAAFADRALTERHRLTSANSINLGRLLPQMTYIARAALAVAAETGTAPGFIIPTGNLGHATAAIMARAMGMPVGPIIAATNANPALAEWQTTGVFLPRPSLTTIANAMDVGAPSNFERVGWLPAEAAAMAVERVDDEAIRARIRTDHAASGYTWCPHSATAAEAYARLPDAAREERPWIALATAHPFKFAEIVEPEIGKTIAPLPALAAILGREAGATRIAPTLEAVVEALFTP